MVGQSRAVAAVAGAIRRSRTGKASWQPIGAPFFRPTGVARRRYKSNGRELVRQRESLLKFDMSGVSEQQHMVARLLGAPPSIWATTRAVSPRGRPPPPLQRRPLRRDRKGPPDIQNVLLQILEDGQLMDSMRRSADFRTPSSC